MSVAFYGDYDTTETVVIPFNAFSSSDPSASVTVTDLIATDVEIYKDGSLTERNSATYSGIAVDVDVDGTAGAHWVTIDLSDDNDMGFYVAGSRYSVKVVGVTIDGATINAWIGAFSIGCMLRPTDAGRTLGVTATGEVDVGAWSGVSVSNSSGFPSVNVCGWRGCTVCGSCGVPDVNVCKWKGAVVPTPTNAGYPRVDTHYWQNEAVGGCCVGGVMYPYTSTQRWLTCAVGVHNGLPCVAACTVCSCVIGLGSVSVDTDYGGYNNLAYIIDGGPAVEDALIQAYLKTAYDAGNRTRNYVKAETRTGSGGRWEKEMRLDAGVYTLVFYKQGEYGPDLKDITVA